MLSKLILFITLTLISQHASLGSTPQKPHASKTCYDTLPDMVERIALGVVNISSTTVFNYTVYGLDEFFRFYGIPQERKQTALGSGFIIDQDGFLLTNHHVIDEAAEVMVIFADKRQLKAKIVGKDQKTDLALLQVRTTDTLPRSELKPVALGNSDAVRIAESVVAVGNPFGLQNTVTRGIISAKNRSIGLGPFDNFLQTDASINPGNSGGPLFNTAGEVIGINSAIHSKTGQNSGLSFAIPVNEAKEVLADLKKYGRVPRPWLGILAERISPQLQTYYNLPTAQGVLVYRLIESGPADTAGFQPGDILVSIDGKTTLESYDVERLLAKHKPLETISIQFFRGSRLQEKKIKLTELPRLNRLPRGVL
jgi:serine protease Do